MLTASVCCCWSSGPTSPKISVTKCFWSCLTPNLKQPALTHRVYWFKPPGAKSTVLSCHQLLISQHVERRPDNILSISEPRFYLKTDSDISPAPSLILTGGSPKFQLFTFLKKSKISEISISTTNLRSAEYWPTPPQTWYSSGRPTLKTMGSSGGGP